MGNLTALAYGLCLAAFLMPFFLWRSHLKKFTALGDIFVNEKKRSWSRHSISRFYTRLMPVVISIILLGIALGGGTLIIESMHVSAGRVSYNLYLIMSGILVFLLVFTICLSILSVYIRRHVYARQIGKQGYEEQHYCYSMETLIGKQVFRELLSEEPDIMAYVLTGPSMGTVSFWLYYTSDITQEEKDVYIMNTLKERFVKEAQDMYTHQEYHQAKSLEKSARHFSLEELSRLLKSV